MNIHQCRVQQIARGSHPIQTGPDLDITELGRRIRGRSAGRNLRARRACGLLRTQFRHGPRDLAGHRRQRPARTRTCRPGAGRGPATLRLASKPMLLPGRISRWWMSFISTGITTRSSRRLCGIDTSPSGTSSAYATRLGSALILAGKRPHIDQRYVNLGWLVLWRDLRI